MTSPARARGFEVGAPGAAVEVATWQPLRMHDVDGWRVGLSDGFTRRANSVLPWRAPADTVAAVTAAEAAYAARGLPCVFRIDASAQPGDLDEVLAARGYTALATTRVMARDVHLDAPVAPDRTGAAITAADRPDDAWLGGWLDVKAAGHVVDADVARAVVAGSPARYLTARDEDGVTGVVRVAVAGEWVGLSCLMVAPRARRRGLARALTIRALTESAALGARQAFLQVEATNAPAAALYADLGFVVVDEYHYRERAAS